jgi:hypothetical protein
MAKIVPNIEKLLRTNTALIFLCVISIGVLVILFRRDDAAKPVAAPVIVGTEQGSNPSVNANGDEIVPSLAASPYRNAPAPEKLPSFTFKDQSTVETSFTCTDTYDVALIYPISIDYRLYPLSSLYNRATACVKGATEKRVISLEKVRVEIGMEYYIVRAHQGKKGSWYGPY